MNIMIDLETMSLAPNAAIISIGAIAFDANHISNSFYTTIDLADCQKLGLDINAETVLWWLSQSKAAQDSLVSSTNVPLLKALTQLTTWVASYEGPALQVWSNGYKDLQWLESAYAVCEIERPWQYWQERDFRTIKAVLPYVSIPDESIAHHAMYDARWQARYLMEVVKQGGEVTL